MTYLLDTNICIAYLNGRDERVRQSLLSTSPEQICLCSVVKGELYYGARKSKRVEANLRELDAFFEPFESLPFDDRASEAYGFLRQQLGAVGKPIGGNDLMIAAIALVRDLVLVTRNQDEFNRVSGLRVVHW